MKSRARNELDRLAGEILRRQDETDACLDLYRRREYIRCALAVVEADVDYYASLNAALRVTNRFARDSE